MADWRDGFREGSFRGVDFKTESHSVEGGRRKQDREFAKRDIGNSEDLGKKLKKFRLELLVIGDDYFAQRDALEAALDAEGSGELVHPYRGTIQVQAGAYTLTETKIEGRIARFSCEFTLAGEVRYPDQVEDDLNNALDRAAALKDNSKTFFEIVFSVANQPAFVVKSAEDALSGALDFAENAVVSSPINCRQPLTGSLRSLQTTPKRVSEFLGAFRLLRTTTLLCQ
jgi:prophage DNA circulation protein